MPASEGVSKLMACQARSNGESNLHFSFWNVIAVTFNVAVPEKILGVTKVHVECTVNSSRRAALNAIEGKIPATATVETF